jgi:hypothetical protein
MEAGGIAKRTEGNVEHDAAQAKQYAEGAADGLLGGEPQRSYSIFPMRTSDCCTLSCKLVERMPPCLCIVPAWKSTNLHF